MVQRIEPFCQPRLTIYLSSYIICLRTYLSIYIYFIDILHFWSVLFLHICCSRFIMDDGHAFEHSERLRYFYELLR